MLNQKKFLVTGDGKRLSIERLGTGRKEVVVIVPGYNQSKETVVFRKIAADLVKDFDCISVDMRGHGLSEGLYTFGSKETDDLKAIIDYAHKHYKKVHLLGFSMGAFTAINEVARFNNVSDMALVSAPMSFRDIEGHFWKPRSIRIGIHSIREGDRSVTLGNPFLKKEAPKERIADIKVPVLFVHGDRDPIINVRHCRELYSKANEPKKLKIFEGGNHAEELYRQFPEEFINTVKVFFKEGANDGKYEDKGGDRDKPCEQAALVG